MTSPNWKITVEINGETHLLLSNNSGISVMTLDNDQLQTLATILAGAEMIVAGNLQLLEVQERMKGQNEGESLRAARTAAE